MFGDYEKAISILKIIEGKYRGAAELESDGHRFESAQRYFEKAEGIKECIEALQSAWTEEEKAFAQHYDIKEASCTLH